MRVGADVRTGMRIEKLETRLISCPLKRTVDASSFTKTRRCTVLVRIETDTGTVGRVYAGDKRENQEQIAEYVLNEIAPVVGGEDPFDVERLWERLRDRSSDVSDRELYMHALGAVDSAIWDTIGRSLEVPLYELWGGYRETLPMIAIGGYYEDGKGIDGLVEEALEYRELGFNGMKLKVGGVSVEEDLERLAAVCDELGPEFSIACDANQAWDLDRALTFAEAAAGHDLAWLEEPVVWFDQYRGMSKVRRRTGVPVTAGQNEITPTGCERLVSESSVDILNYDASLGGGPTAWRKVAASAELQGVQMGHHEEPHVAMHLLASVPNGGYLEGFHPDLDPVWYRMVSNTPPLEDGTLTLPDGPGFGLEFDSQFVADHTVQEGVYAED